MESVLIVYKTDSHHSYASRDIIGIATSIPIAVAICKAQAKKEGHRISEQENFNLRNLKQTQGYKGEGEFQFEGVNLNTLL